MTYTWDYGIDVSKANAAYHGTTNYAVDAYALFIVPLTGLRTGLNFDITRAQMNMRLYTSPVTAARVGVWDVSGTSWTAQADLGTFDRTGWTESNTQVKSVDLSSSPLSCTKAATSHLGILCDRNGVAPGDNTSPGVRAIAAVSSYNGNTVERIAIASSEDPTAFTLGTNTASTAPTGAIECIEMRFTTDQNLVTDIASPHTSGTSHFLIPALVSGNATYCIKFEDVVVGPGNSLTIDLMDTTAASSTLLASMNAYFDDSGTGAVGFNGDESVSTFTAGDTYDLIIQVNATTGAMKFAWINKTTGEGPISVDDHTVKDFDAVFAGTRNTWRTQGEGTPRVLRLAGTATVGRLQVAAMPLIMHFDSQGYGSTPLTVNSGRLVEALNSTWGTASKQMQIIAGQGSGGRLATNNAAKACTLTHFDVSDAAIGVYDIKEIRGRHVIQTCINDFAGSASSLLSTMQAIADEALANGDEVVFTDAPPAASSAFSSAESAAIRQHSADVLAMNGYNAAVFGVNVSWAKFNGGLDGSGIYQPKNVGTWFESSPDLLHFKAAGSAVAVQTLAPAILDGGLYVGSTEQRTISNAVRGAVRGCVKSII